MVKRRSTAYYMATMVDKVTQMNSTVKNRGKKVNSKKGSKSKSKIVTHELDELDDAMDLLFSQSRAQSKSFQDRVKLKSEE